MNLRCPRCQTLYRLDPPPLPIGEKRAQCGRCDEVFRIADQVAEPAIELEMALADAEGATHSASTGAEVEGVGRAERAWSEPGPGIEAVGTAEEAAMDRFQVSDDGTPLAAADDEGQETAKGEAEHPTEVEMAVKAGGVGDQSETEGEAAEAVSAPAEPTSESESPFRFFGPQDPHQRARHLARALVSDIVAYYPDRLERSRAAGNLKEEFREEVLKSWEEFVLQVGADFAQETDHFQRALNEILAEGTEVF